MGEKMNKNKNGNFSKEKTISKLIFAVAMTTAFAVVFGPAIQAHFYRITGDAGWGYGYGYGYGSGYGTDDGSYRTAGDSYDEYLYDYGYGSLISAPTITTSAASSIVSSSATLNGNITATGDNTPTARGFQYGLTTSYGSTAASSGSSFSTGAFSENISGLTCGGTTYHFRAYATNVAGTAYGDDTTFTSAGCGGGGGGGSAVIITPVVPAPEVEEEDTTADDTVVEEETSQQESQQEALISQQALAALPYASGTLLKVKGDSTVWLIENGKRKGIPSASILEAKYRWEDVVEVLSSSVLSEYAVGENAKYPDGTLVKGSGNTVYVVADNGQKRGITSAEVFEGLGYKWENIVTVSDAEISAYPTAGAVASADAHPNGALINDNGTIYQIINGQRRGIPTPNVFETNRFGWDNVAIATVNDKALPAGTNLSFPDGTLIREQNTMTVYVVADSQKRGITSAEIFENKGYKWENILDVTTEEIAPLTEGMVIE